MKRLFLLFQKISTITFDRFILQKLDVPRSYRTLVEFSSTNCLPIHFPFAVFLQLPIRITYNVYMCSIMRNFSKIIRFNKIIIIFIVVINEIIWEMVYFWNDTNISYEKQTTKCLQLNDLFNISRSNIIWYLLMLFVVRFQNNKFLDI